LVSSNSSKNEKNYREKIIILRLTIIFVLFLNLKKKV